MASEFNPWIICPEPNPHASIRLFCFPYSGGGASVFTSWAEYLPPEIEVCAIQLPGRENRFGEPFFESLSSLVQELGPYFEPYLDKPFVSFGHCMGSVISFEIARYLRKHYKKQPLHLFVAAHWAPQCMHVIRPIHNLSDEDFIKELHLLKGTSERVLQNKDLLQLMLPMLKADFTLGETYQYVHDEPLQSSISALGGTEDNRVSPDDLLPWKEQTTGSFSSYMYPGGHFFLHTARQKILQTISQALQSYIEHLK